MNKACVPPEALSKSLEANIRKAFRTNLEANGFVYDYARCARYLRYIENSGMALWKDRFPRIIGRDLYKAIEQGTVTPNWNWKYTLSRVLGFGYYIGSLVCKYTEIPQEEQSKVVESCAILNLLVSLTDKIIDDSNEGDKVVEGLLKGGLQGLLSPDRSSLRTEEMIGEKTPFYVAFLFKVLEYYLNTLREVAMQEQYSWVWTEFFEATNEMMRSEAYLARVPLLPDQDIKEVSRALRAKSVLPFVCLILNGLLISGSRAVTIQPLPGPGSPIPGVPGLTVGDGGGAVTTGGAGSSKQPDGSPGTGPDGNPGSDCTTYVDMSNNGGAGYPHGAPMWLVLAHELTSGHAFHMTQGTDGPSAAEAETQAIESENTHREEHGLPKHPLPGDEAPPDGDGGGGKGGGWWG